MEETRFLLWSAGKIDDEDLTIEEVRWLEEAVLRALQEKFSAVQSSALVQ